MASAKAGRETMARVEAPGPAGRKRARRREERGGLRLKEQVTSWIPKGIFAEGVFWQVTPLHPQTALDGRQGLGVGQSAEGTEVGESGLGSRGRRDLLWPWQESSGGLLF